MSYENPKTGFTNLNLKNQEIVIYAGVAGGPLLLPIYPFKIGCRMEGALPTTVVAEVSADDGNTWNTLATFSLDTPNQWVVTEAIITDSFIIKAKITSGIGPVSCIIGG